MRFFAVTLAFLSVTIHVRAKVIPYYDLNCSIELSSDWKSSYDSGSRDALAKQMFLRGPSGRETAMVVVGSEVVNPGGVVGHDEVYDGLIDAMLARFNAQRTIRSGSLSLAGVDGAFRVATTMSETGESGFAGTWYGEKNGFLYSLTLVDQGPATKASGMIKEFNAIGDGFSVIDPMRLGFSGSQPRAQSWVGHGVLSVDLAALGWLELEQAPSDYMHSWVFGNIGSLDVGVVPLGGLELKEDVIREAIFSFLQVNRQLSTKSKPVATELGGAAGYFIQVEQQDSQLPLVQYLKFATVDGYLVYSWVTCAADEVTRQYPQLVSMVDEAMQVVQVDEPAVSFAVAPELADFYNELGLAISRRSSPAVAYPLIAQAYTCAPDNPVYLTNVLDVALLVQQEADAKELVKHCNPELLLDPNVLARLALIESRSGSRAEAMELFEQAIDLRLRDTDYIGLYLDMLSEEGRSDEALATLSQLRESGQERDLMLLEVGFYLRKEAYDEAAEVLRDLEALFYRDANSVLFWSEVFLSTGQLDECIAMCEEYLATDRNAGVMVSLARALIEKKEIRSAKVWIEHAIELSPTDQSLKTYHDFVSGMLGRQGNVVLDFEVQPLPVADASIAPVSHPRVADEIAAGAHFDLYSKAIEFSDEGEYKTTLRYKLTIHDKAGLREWNEIGIPFEPLYEKLYVNYLRVYNGAGELVFEGAGDMDSLYVVEDTSSGILTNGKSLRIPLVGLEVGASAELMVSIVSASTPDQLPFKEHFFASRIPVRVSTLSVVSPDGTLVTQAFNFDEASAKVGDGVWRIEYPSEFRNEAHLPEYPDYAAFVVTGPSGDSWEAQGNRYWEDVSHVFAANEWTEAVVESIQSAHPNDMKAQMAAAMAYVQDRLRYQGVLFGVRYQIPNIAEDVLRNGYGDCKDHSLLLVQLLQALGIESCPFLLNTNGVYSGEITTTDQFNHMLVYASLSDVDYFLDATKKGQEALLPDLGLAGSYGLVVQENASRIAQIPPIVEAVDVRINRMHLLGQDGKTMSVSETAEFSRAAADKYRDVIYHVSRRDIDEWLEMMLSYRNVDVDLLQSDMGDLFDLSSGMTVNLSYDLYDYNAIAEGWVTNAFGWEGMYLNFKGNSSRKLPFEIKDPIQLTTTSRFKASDGWSLKKQAIKDSADTVWCEWEFSIEDIGDSIEMTASISLQPGIYPASDYTEFRRAIGQFLAHLHTPIQVQRGQAE